MPAFDDPRVAVTLLLERVGLCRPLSIRRRELFQRAGLGDLADRDELVGQSLDDVGRYVGGPDPAERRISSNTAVFAAVVAISLASGSARAT